MGHNNKPLVNPKGCTLCSLRDRQPNTKIVPGYGNHNADIMFVCEAPGSLEAQMGLPFVGRSGEVLDELLNNVGLSRENVYISNVCKCWPWAISVNKRTGAESFTNRTPTNDELKICSRYLKEEIALVKPKIIIPLGSSALTALEGKKSKISNRAGIPSIYSTGGEKVTNLYKNSLRTYMIPTYHPSFILRNGGVKSSVSSEITVIASEVIRHLKKAKELSENKELFVEHQYRVVDTREKLEKVISIIKSRKVMSFDIETTGLEINAKILGIGIGLGVGIACYVPFLVRPFMGDSLVSFWDDKGITKDEVVERLKDLFGDTSIQMSAHNAKFDMRGLEKDLGIVVKGLFWDSMCSAYLINENSPNALDILKNQYIDLLGYSDAFKRETDNGKNASKASLKTISNYCCGDCDATYRLTKEHIELFKTKPNLMNLMINFYVPIMEFIKDFEYVGVEYNVEKAKSMREEYEKKSQKMLEDIYKHVGCRFNPSSNDELPKVLFNILGLKHSKKTESGKQSTDSAVLEDLSKEHIVPKLIIDYRHFEKMRSTYMDSFIRVADENNRLHLATSPIGTITGRPSSKGLMNIPKELKIKSLFQPRKGCAFVQGDLSQAEVRCFAHYANEEILRDAYEKGTVDVHCLLASEANNIPYEEFIQRYNNGDKDVAFMRQAAKSLVFGILYGRGAKSIALQLGIEVNEAEAFMKKFFDRFTNCDAWIKNTHELVHKTGEVMNIFGRVRHIPGIFSNDSNIVARSERQSVNSIIQSTASDITMYSLIEMHEFLKKEDFDANIVLTVYDSIIVETPHEHVDFISNKLVEVMERKRHPDFSIRMKADVDLYSAWGVPYKNSA